MIEPHGGYLVDRIATGSDKENLMALVEGAPKIILNNRHVSDCEMIAIGGFSPLSGFLNRENAESVIEKMSLADGTLWSIPIVLPVKDPATKGITPGTTATLWDPQDRMIAVIKIEEIFELELTHYCTKIFKTTKIDHPGVKAILEDGSTFVSGKITLVNRPVRDEIDLKYFMDPVQIRAEIAKKGWRSIVAFQTRNPIHRAHEYLIKCALEQADGVLIHPLVGETKPDDIPAHIRMSCYQVLMNNYFNPANTMLSVLPTTMRYGGPREAIHHMIMRKNYGCTHMIIGRDHAGISDYYGTYEAQDLVKKYPDSLQIKPLNFEHSFYCNKCNGMASKKTCPHPVSNHLHLSGVKVRAMLQKNEMPPPEFTRPEVAKILIERKGT